MGIFDRFEEEYLAVSSERADVHYLFGDRVSLEEARVHCGSS